MKKRFKRLLGKKGLSLVEILVVLFVSSILLAIALGMLVPVKNLMNSIKGNAHQDSLCDTVNEYIRGTLQGAKKISIFTAPDSSITGFVSEGSSEKLQDKIKNQYSDYKSTLASNESIHAIAVLKNYNDDYRIYDFGDVDAIIGTTYGTSLYIGDIAAVINHRDGGGSAIGGIDGPNFHRYDVFKEAFYNSGFSGEVNFSYQMSFDAKGRTLFDEDGNEISGVSGVDYISVKSQVFKRTGKNYWDGEKVVMDAKFEPYNQERSTAFKLLSGDATLDSSLTTGELVDNSDPSNPKLNGVVILYVAADLSSIS